MRSILKTTFDALPPVVRAALKHNILKAGAALNIVPTGAHFVFDIKRRLGANWIKTVFDVGANIGQSVKEYRAEFPDAEIFSFEPDPQTFSRLQQSLARERRVQVFEMALSSKPGELRFDNTSQVTEIHAIARDQSDQRFPLVNIATLDQFCSSKQIGGIDLLKIDTEGHDLEVLRGASSMLGRGEIKLISAECSFAHDSPRLVQFVDIQAELRRFGYRLFGLYNQSFASASGSTCVAWGNCAFVSPSLINMMGIRRGS